MAGAVFLIGKGGAVLVSAEDIPEIFSQTAKCKVNVYKIT